MFLMQTKRFLDGLLLMDPPLKREVHDAAVPRVVKLGRIESLGNIWRDQEVWPEGRWAGRWMPLMGHGVGEVVSTLWL